MGSNETNKCLHEVTWDGTVNWHPREPTVEEKGKGSDTTGIETQKAGAIKSSVWLRR